jgi:hypothetical protein
MKTTIDNNQRVFMIHTSTGDRVFCNLHDIGRVLSELGANAGYFDIHHFWDGKPKRASKKYIREMLAADKREIPTQLL